MKAWHYFGGCAALTVAVTVLWAQAESATVKEDPAIGIARLEERVKALDVMVKEKADQVKTALEAADRVTSKSFPSRTDFSDLSDRVAALETGAAGGAGRIGGVGSARELTLTAIPIGLSVISLLVVLFLAFGRRQAPKAP